MPQTRQPNFFIVGASRAGTTSLWRYLVEHPDVYMPRRAMAEKEPSHFCELPPRWALAYRDRDAYLSLFAQAGDRRAVGEASTAYLVAPEVPERIHAAYPDARIIIVLRNPADRAFSLYRYLCLNGSEWARSFEKALDLERVRMSDPGFKRNNPLWYYLFLYYHSGLYAEQVERYLTTFPPEQVQVILFDDLERDTLRTAQQVYRFLGVDPTFVPRVAKYNDSRFPLSVSVQHWLSRNVDFGAEGHLGPIRGHLLLANVKLGSLLHRPFKTETRRRLLDAYRQDIFKTGTLIKRSLDHWVELDGLH